MLFLSTAWAYETGLLPETGIPGFWNKIVPVSGRTGEDTVYSSTARYMPFVIKSFFLDFIILRFTKLIPSAYQSPNSMEFE